MSGRHHHIMLLLLFIMIRLLTISTSSTQIRVNSPNNLIDSIISFIVIHQNRSPWLNIQTTGRTRNAVWKSDFLFWWFLVARLFNHTLMLASDTWAVVFAFFVYLANLLVAIIVFHLAQGWSLSFSLFCFWSKVFTAQRVFA